MNVLRVLVRVFARVWFVPNQEKYEFMNPISIVLLGSMLIGCTTLRPIDVDAVTLHQKIRSGEAVQVGDTIRAITIDGVANHIYVTEVNKDYIKGYPPGATSDTVDISLPIEDIVLVEVRRISADSGRTFASGAGIGAAAIGLLLLIGIIGF